MNFDRHDDTAPVVFWKCLRLFFVLFSLYLTGDAFYRWDGFSFYASFSEFIPSVSLAFILWSAVAYIAAVVFWMSLTFVKRGFNALNCSLKFDHLILCAVIFVILGTLAWKGKRIIWPVVETTLSVKMAVLLLTALSSIYTAWLLRNKAFQWIKAIMHRLTPLVWIFSTLLLLSFPIVIYHAWGKDDNNLTSPKAFDHYGMEKERPNIILITFDALAAREMSLYGYSRDTTPFISQWAKNASVFSRAEAGSNFTTPAAASLMTGKRVWTHQTYHIAGSKPVRSHIENLAYLLKEKGYYNMAFVVNPFASVRVLGISGSFDIAPLTSEFGTSASLFGWKFGVIDKMLYRAFGDKIRLHNWVLKNEFVLSKFLNLISRNITQTTVPPETVFKRFLEGIDSNLPRPFLAWIHVFPPHDPYLPPEPHKGKFNPSSEMRTYKIQEHVIGESYKYLFKYQPFPEDMEHSVNLMRDYYDEFVIYSDRTFEDFITALNKKKVENTVIILTADHGESFDHGYFTHGGPFLYEQVTHIPLIIKEPSQTDGRVINELVEQIDIPATILDLADIPVPSWMEGRSLKPFIRGETLPPRTAFSMNFEENPSRGHKIKRGSIAVWEGDYKLIHYLERNESLLFNLKNDPDEINNIFDTESKTGRRLFSLMQESLAEANKKIETILR